MIISRMQNYLSLYQMRLFFTKSSHAYVCVNCVTIRYLRCSKNFAKTKRNNLFENTIKVQKENEEKLINGIKKSKKKNKDEENLRRYCKRKGLETLKRNIN